MVTYSSKYTGYVYIWYDTIAKLFYIGGHYGRVDDSYICSSKPMKRAYKLRPHTFKFRILEYVYGDKTVLRLAEQHWLDMVKDCELMLSENVRGNTCRYYNVKKTSAGGNGSANKGKSHQAWNKGYTRNEMKLRQDGLLCFIGDKPKVNNKQRKSRTTIPWNKGLRKPKTLNQFTCNVCGSQFESYHTDRTACSPSCAGKIPWINGTAIPGFEKGQDAWNKGLPNPTSSINGKKGAKKLSEKVKGRKLAIRSDGTRYWDYPEK